MTTTQELLQFYTFTSRDVNMYSEFPKKFRAFVKNKEGYKFLPTQPYVVPLTGQKEIGTSLPIDIHYNGTLTEEQDYIMDIIHRRRKDYKYHCGLINMKTGRGKSHIIMNIVNEFKVPTLILCHNTKTLLEMVDKFKEYTGMDIGVYYSDKKNIRSITVTTHDSFVLNNGIIDAAYFPVILYDECDYNLSQQMLNALCKSSAMALYGFTGTPYSKHFNNADMQKIFGKEIQYVDSNNTTGYNIIPKIETYRYKSTAFKEYEYNNWAEEKQCLVDDKDRLSHQIKLVEHYMNLGRKTILILTERVEESENYLTNLIEHYHSKDGYEGTPAIILINGQTKLKDDNKLIAEYVGKGPCIIIGTIGKMARGVDIPAVDTIMLFSALHFRGTVVQAVGRCLRTYPGKTESILVDWQDYPILANQWYARKKAYIKEYGIKSEDIISYNINKDDGYSLQ